MSANGPPQRGNAGVVSAEQLQRTCITGRVSVVERRRVRHSLYEIPRPLRSLIRSARPLRHIRQCSRRYRYLPERKSETAVVRKVLQRKPWCIGYVFLCDDLCQLVIECLPHRQSWRLSLRSSHAKPPLREGSKSPTDRRRHGNWCCSGTRQKAEDMFRHNHTCLSGHR